MIIAHIVSSLDPNQGGPPNVVLNFAKFQKMAGHDIIIVSEYDKKNFKNLNNLEGIKIEKGKFFIKKHYIPNFNFIIKIFKTIKKADIVHLHGVWNGVISISAFLSRLLKKKVVITPHGSLDSYNINNKYFYKKFFYYIFEKYNLNYIQSFHFLNYNEFKNSSWIKILKKKNILIQSNGYDLDFLKKLKIKKKFNKKKIQITYIGRLNKIKNLELQLTIMKHLSKKNKIYKLNIIGPDDDLLDNLKKKVKELGLNKNIKFYKPVYGKKKYTLIKNSDIMILTSFYECNSILAIETMALGGVLLCTSNCNLNHAAKFGAVKMSNYEITSLIASIHYLSKKKNSDFIRKKAFQYAQKNLNIKTTTKNIIKFYKQITNNKLN